MSRTEPPDEFADLSALIARAQADRPARDPSDPEVVAAARRSRRQRRVVAATVVLAVTASLGTYLPVTLLAPASAATVTIRELDLAQPTAAVLSLPQVGASAVSVTGGGDFAQTTGTAEIVASSGSTGPLPIASISKLITTLVVLDAKPLGESDSGPTITFSENDADLFDKYYVMQATVQPMKAGSTMSQRDALELMLVVSACNYAEAVSTWAFGSQARFLDATKNWLAANGLSGTRIVEPTGLDPRNVSTPADLIALGRLALAHPVVAAIVGSDADVPTIGRLTNSNTLLGMTGINGIKTGTLEEAAPASCSPRS